MKKTISMFLCTILVFPIIGISQSFAESDLQKLSQANTKFAFNLFSNVSKDKGNIFISPTSISLALTMTYNGAEGITKNDMAKTLCFDEASLDEINQASLNLIKELSESGEGVTLNIANSLWLKINSKFNEEFLKRNKEYFSATLKSVNFGDPKTTEIINNWVKNKTNNKIEKIVDKVSNLTKMILINAVYFKGTWSDKFDKNKTKEKDFTLTNSSKKKVKMMRQSGTYSYYKGDNFQAASLPYGKGRFQMYIFLPDSNTNLSAFTKTLSHENWQKWSKEFKEMDGDIELPRFKIDYKITLNDTLKALGMKTAFNPNEANFKGIATSAGINFYIDEVLHKTFLDINEEGTEAAAVTSVGMKATSMPIPKERFSMIMEHPFFLSIVDTKTNNILFMGLIKEPK